MKYIEDKLEQLDKYFAPKKESEKWLVILGVAAVIAYLAFAYLLPYTEEVYKKSDRSKKSLQQSVIDKNTYLDSVTVEGDRNAKVKEFSNIISMKKKDIQETRSKIKFINNNLDKLSDMLFNKKSWSSFLNSLTDKAEMHNIDIMYISNYYVDNNGSFGHVLEITLGCKGHYKGIVKFMNELEQSTLVTDIYGSELSIDANSSEIVADINISVWGVNH